MKTFNLAEAKQLAFNYEADVKKLDVVTGLLFAPENGVLREAFFCQSSYFDRNEKSAVKIGRAYINRLRHEYWLHVFEGSDVWTRYPTSRNKEREALLSNYLMKDRFNSNDTHDGRDLLEAPTVENIKAFFDTYMQDTNEYKLKVINVFLDRCGADWKKRPAKFTRRMTFRASGWHDYEYRAMLLDIIELYNKARNIEYARADLDKELTANQSRANVSLFGGLLNWTKNANGNATIIFSDGAVTFFNSLLTLEA